MPGQLDYSHPEAVWAEVGESGVMADLKVFLRNSVVLYASRLILMSCESQLNMFVINQNCFGQSPFVSNLERQEKMRYGSQSFKIYTLKG